MPVLLTAAAPREGVGTVPSLHTLSLVKMGRSRLPGLGCLGPARSRLESSAGALVSLLL